MKDFNQMIQAYQYQHPLDGMLQSFLPQILQSKFPMVNGDPVG